MCKGVICYQAHIVSVFAIMVTKKYEYKHTHLRKSEIRSNYESPFRLTIDALLTDLVVVFG